jgi:hypothetical protein
MKSARLLFTTTFLVAVVVTASSCGDTATTGPIVAGPATRSVGGIITMVKQTLALIDSCSSLPSASVTQIIDRKGGMIVVGPDTLRVPANALSLPVAITATLPDGYFVNVVQFQPTGLRFKKPAALSMGYSNCNVLGSAQLQIAQVDDNLNVIQYLNSSDNKKTKTVVGAVPHFSNYAIAW